MCEVLSGIESSWIVPEGDFPWLQTPFCCRRSNSHLYIPASNSGCHDNGYENYWVTKRGDRRLIAWSNTALLGADDKVFPAIKAGALGYILKDSGPAELVQAIHSGLSRAAVARALHCPQSASGALPSPPAAAPTPEPLSERELEVLRLLAQGKSNREIADQLVITELTVRTHVSNILDKLHLTSRTQAALYTLK